MIALRFKYWSAPEHGERASLSESKQISSKLARRLQFKGGVFSVFPASDICSHDLVDLATVKCETCKLAYCSECSKVLHRSPVRNFFFYFLLKKKKSGNVESCH